MDKTHHRKKKSRVTTDAWASPETKRSKTEKQSSAVAVPSLSLDQHLAAAKPFLLHRFMETYQSNLLEELWDSLAGTEWQKDVDICCMVLSRGLPPTKAFDKDSPLLQDEAVLEKFLKSPPTNREVENLWKMMAPKFRRKPQLALVAMSCGLAAKKIDKKIIGNPKIFKDGLANQVIEWDNLPKKFKKDVEFALLARSVGGAEMGQDFVHVSEQVTDKHKLWVEWACKHPLEITGYDYHDTWGGAPDSILSDPSLMLQVIVKYPKVVEHLRPSLVEDETFLLASLETNVLVLSHLTTETLQQFPSLLSSHWIQQFAKEKKSPNGLLSIIPEPLWEDRDFVLNTWFVAGGLYSPSLPDEFSDDEEVLLTYAKYNHDEDENSRCVRISTRLKADKTFLKKMLTLSKKGWILKGTPLESDYEMQLLACAVSPTYRPYSRYFQHRDRRRFYRKIRQQLQEHRNFFDGVLCGIHKDSGSKLVILDQGSDANVKKRIASFCDFVVGESLPNLFLAAKNLSIIPNENFPNRQLNPAVEDDDSSVENDSLASDTDSDEELLHFQAWQNMVAMQMAGLMSASEDEGDY